MLMRVYGFVHMCIDVFVFEYLFININKHADKLQI